MSEVISDDVTRDDVRGIVISPDILEPLKNTYVKHQITSKVITGKQKVRSGLHAGGGGGWGFESLSPPSPTSPCHSTDDWRATVWAAHSCIGIPYSPAQEPVLPPPAHIPHPPPPRTAIGTRHIPNHCLSWLGPCNNKKNRPKLFRKCAKFIKVTAQQYNAFW